MSSRSTRIYKFGGASVKSAEGVKNIAAIVRESTDNLVVVVSAMGKTTNALEILLSAYMGGSEERWQLFANLRSFHLDIAKALMCSSDTLLNERLEYLFGQMHALLSSPPANGYDYCYDQLVCYGELLSTAIVSAYLSRVGVDNQWIDVRTCIQSDTTYREAMVDFVTSGYHCKKSFTFNPQQIYLTQGFIAGTPVGTTTTLGREGSDYTAAILANLLDAQDVTIWKDVDGVLNADPRIFPNTQKLDFVSFQEAIELAYCGAQIIHPKTIKPLQNKLIPLYVKSFLNPSASGTKILHSDIAIKLPPILVLKQKQVLLSMSPRDFSFIIEDSLSKIFALLYKHRVKVNIVQSSAISFTVCVDDEPQYLPAAIEDLKRDFVVRYNSNLELLTVRHYTTEVLNEHIGNRTVYLQQRTRSTGRFVMDVKER
ncbi:MAG: aspartate kinase [Bacteroidales bacterium]|nr:aspartate kinase [Bacteroidales bacterium]MBN2749374.1 aspartate kinase [Bacteroidales bacterium]